MPNYAERVLASEMSANKLDEQIEGGEIVPAVRAPNEGRRSLLQIKVDILRAVESGYGKPTQIMYRANLSWNVLQVQLKSFLETGMLEVQTYGSRRRYLITSKGSEMVDSYQKVVKEILR